MKFPLQHICKVSKFIVSNALGTVVDTAVLWICSCFIFVDYGYVGEYLVSPLISFEFAVFTNYLCSWFFIWRDRATCYGRSAFARKYLAYNFLSSATFLIKMSILLLLERLFGWNVVICNLVALCLSGCINFAMGEWVIFRKNEITSRRSTLNIK